MIHLTLGRFGGHWGEAVRLTREARDNQIPVILLVPQQYTLQTERELMKELHVSGFFDLDVLSPTRLSQRVFDQAGGSENTRIDARGKAMAMAGVLHSRKKQLRYYTSSADKQGLCDCMGAMIANLKRAKVSPDMLLDYAQQVPPGARQDKLMDLALIYQGYEEVLQGRFVDGEDVQRELAKRVREAPMMRGTRLIIYGFDMLTGDLTNLMAAADPIAEEIDLLLCCDPEDRAFSPVTDSVVRFQTEMQERGIPYRMHHLDAPLTAPGEIRALEKGILSGGGRYEGHGTSVRLYAAPTPYAESYFVAREILLHHLRGVEFGDMQVIVCDEARYCSTLDAVLTDCAIPHYIAKKVCAADIGAAQFLIYSLRAVANGFRADDVLAALRTGYFPLTQEEQYRMENYVLEYGIGYKRFCVPFTRGKEKAQALEDARQRMMAPLLALRQGLAESKKPDEALQAIMDFLTSVDAFETMMRDAQALEDAGMPDRASKLRQVWKTLMELLDQMHELLPDAHVTGTTAALLMEAGLTGTQLSALPAQAGCVVCGILGNIAVSRPKVLFVMGLNDGVLTKESNGLLTEEEMQDAQNHLNAYLALDDDGREMLARLDLYKAVSSPTDTLILSHAQAMQDGTALRPLSMMRTVREILPEMIEEGGVTAPQGPSIPLSRASALEGLGPHLREGAQDDWLSAWHWMCGHDRDAAERLLLPFSHPAPEKTLPRDIVRKLYRNHKTSVSQLETFAECPFRYFVEYGLSPVPRGEWKMDKLDMGIFYHAAIEGFTKALQNDPVWPQIEREQCDQMMDKAIEPAMTELMTGLMEDSSCARAAAQICKRTIKRAAWTFTKAAKQSVFVPEAAEVRFGDQDSTLPPILLTLEDGSKVLVHGKIDRIDRYQGDEGLYLRVIDYKSSAQGLTAEKIYWGTQLQLLLYLYVALQGHDGAIPAGAYYFPLTDPLIQNPKLKEDVEKSLAKKLALKGLTLKDAQIIRLMDQSPAKTFLPPGLVNKDGECSDAAGKPLATQDEMRALLLLCVKNAQTLLNQMMTGDVSASPIAYKNEQQGVCSYCDYAPVCRKGALLGCVQPRQKPEMKFDELLKAAADDLQS